MPQAPISVTILGLLMLHACSSENDPISDQTPEGPHLNVVLICLDTVRAGHLGTYGYERYPTSPHIDRLAQSAWVFRNASSTANWTKPSVATYLTGLLPAQHGVYQPTKKKDGVVVGDMLPLETTTLAETYAAHGYATHALVTNTQIASGLGYEQGFETYLNPAGDAAQICGAAGDWLEEQKKEQRPFFLYLHFLDAHPPLRLSEEALASLSDPADPDSTAGPLDWNTLRREVNRGKRQLDGTAVDILTVAYDQAIRSIDDELGKLFAVLERAGQMEETVICVISDHGEEFFEQSRLGHGRGHDLYESLLHVALILRVPGLGSREIETPCSLVDLYPTLVAAAGLTSDEVQGFGIDRIASPEESRPIIAEHLDDRGYQQSVRLGNKKLLRSLMPSSKSRRHRISRELLAETYADWTSATPKPHSQKVRTYDLALDPGEQDPAKDQQHSELIEVGQRLLRINLQQRIWGASDQVELSMERLEALRAIGYAGDDDLE